MQSYCQLRVLILYELLDSPFLADVLPLNALRNAAILAATTPMVAMLDVDMLVSKNLVDRLAETGDPQIMKDMWVHTLIWAR